MTSQTTITVTSTRKCQSSYSRTNLYHRTGVAPHLIWPSTDLHFFRSLDNYLQGKQLNIREAV